MNKKRLILINLILIAMFNILPAEKLPLKETTQVATITTEITTEPLVSSRSGKREKAKENPVATTYSEELYEMVKGFESFRAEAYKNEGEEYWTIGYGHYGADVKEGQTITEEQAERLLRADLNGICEFILKQDKGFNQNQLDALCSFGMNLGAGNVRKLIKGRTKEEIPEHMLYYTKSGSEIYRQGLLNRREKEKELYEKEIN